MRYVGAIVAVCGTFAAATVAAATPLDDPAFSQYVVNRLTLIETPDVRVAVDGPFHIIMTYPSGGTVATSLDLLHSNCVATPVECEDFIAAYVDQWWSTDPRHVPRATVDPVQFWAAVVPPSISSMSPANGIGLVTGPWIGNLSIRCRIGGYDLQASQLEPLQLEKNDAVALCRKHTVENQKPFSGGIPNLPLHSNDTLRTLFATSLLLSLDEWGKVAVRFDGELIVAAPDTDSVVYGHGASASDIEALVNQARIVATNNADNPTKAAPNWKVDLQKCCTVYRWTAGGWTVASP